MTTIVYRNGVVAADTALYHNSLYCGMVEKINKIKAVNGKHSADSIHKKLGHIMWDFVGMGRTKEGLEHALSVLKKFAKLSGQKFMFPDRVLM